MTSRTSRTHRLTAGLAFVAASTAGLALAGPSTASTDADAAAAANGKRVNVQLLSFNDFHGNLQPPAGSSGRIVTGHTLDGETVTDTTVDAGGVEYLAAHLKAARRGLHGNTLTVAAGDIVGASPLLSAAFHDEPTVEAMNKLGLDATAVGNHEFDEGYKEIKRLARGGCLNDGDGKDNQNSCPNGTFAGADYDILAANVKFEGTTRSILPSFTIKEVGGAKIGFIGMTLKDTPNIVTQAGVEGLEFLDEVETANALVPRLKRQGADAVIVLIHQGDVPGTESWVGPDGVTRQVNPAFDAACGNGADATGPLTEIAQNLSPAIDMVISGHTHQPYVCTIPDPAGQPRMVTSASSFGRLFTDTRFVFDRATNDIVRSSVSSTNDIVTRDVAKDPAQTRLINRYTTLVAPLANRELGTITADVTRTTSAAGESALGDLIADAQLADDSVQTGGKEPVIAFMNPGGIRTDLTTAPSGSEAEGVVTYGEAFAVQPFNNYLVSMDMTGAQIKALLTQQWSGTNAASSKILQVSEGFAYTSTGTGAARTLGAVTLDGAPLVDDQSYRIVTNNFLSDGGDGFPAFTTATDKYIGGLDIDAFADYLAANSPYSPTGLDRITYTP